jgi:hypothetical protein
MGVTFEGIAAKGEFRFRLSRLPLSEGRYQIGARVLVDGAEADWPRDGIGELIVESGDFFGSGHKGHEAAPVLISAEVSIMDLANTRPSQLRFRETRC